MSMPRKTWGCLLGILLALAGSLSPGQADSYDPNGNLTARPGQTFVYDAENRLQTVTANGQTTTYIYDGDGQLVKKVAPEGRTLYVGPHYEIRPQPASPPPPPQPTPRPGLTRRVRLPLVFNGYWTLDGRPVQEVKYYLVGGQRIASRTGSAGPVTYYYHDHLGSTVSSSGGESTRYWPFGATRSGSVGTAYRFTGQRQDVAGLYFYQARWYDSTLGRFIQPDSLVPEPGNPQSLNRYSYGLNNPVKYVDDDGHFAFVPLLIIGGIALLKAVDYGWTAYDAAQSLKVVNDPNASEAAKAAATANLAMTVAFEAAEPDDFLPVALPLDDLARKGIVKIGREAAESTAEQGFKSFTKRNFRENLQRLTGKGADEIAGLEAHHVLPRELLDKFKGAGLDIHDPQFGSWVDATAHRQWSYEYNAKWEVFLERVRSPEEILRFAKQLAEEYNFHVYFNGP